MSDPHDLNDLLRRQFAAFLDHKRPDEAPWEVIALSRIPGGASRETYRLRISNCSGTQSPVILRRDPVSSLIDTERELEYAAYQAVYGSNIPVPEPLYLESDPQWLERPFSVMAAIEGCEASPDLILEEPFKSHRQQLGEQKWTLLGQLARLEPEARGLDKVMSFPSTQDCAERELTYWESVINDDAMEPQPVAQAALRWLHKHLPPPPKHLAIVHGDYRTGNFLYNTEGDIKGILDWEMCHIGDPLEDLAWSLDPLWAWPDQQLAGRLLPRSEAIKIWEAAYGQSVDRTAFRWWQIFASIKGLAIWISSCKDYVEGLHKEPIIGMAGLLMVDRQNRILVDRLAPESDHQWAQALFDDRPDEARALDAPVIDFPGGLDGESSESSRRNTDP